MNIKVNYTTMTLTVSYDVKYGIYFILNKVKVEKKRHELTFIFKNKYKNKINSEISWMEKENYFEFDCVW